MPTVYSRHVDPEEKAPPTKKVLPPIKPIVKETPKPITKALAKPKQAPPKKGVKVEDAQRK